MKTPQTLVAAGLIALLATAGVTAAIAADPADPPPPRIAFQANYDPALVVVMRGPVAISDAVVAAVAEATQLDVVDAAPTPDTGVVRAAGGDRFETATVVADLLAAYAPAYLPVGRQAVDADLRPMWAHVAPDGKILAQSGGISATAGFATSPSRSPRRSGTGRARPRSRAGTAVRRGASWPHRAAAPRRGVRAGSPTTGTLVHTEDPATDQYSLLWDVFITVG